MAIIIGTVTTSESVERSIVEADSDSIALYLAASRTTIVATGKLQQTSASRADRGLHGDASDSAQDCSFRQTK